MKSLAELKVIRDRMQNQINLSADDGKNMRVVVGLATCGIASGAKPVYKKISDLVRSRKLDNISVVQTGCIGLCQYEPIVEVYEVGKPKITYIKMTPEKVDEIVEQHFVRGTVLKKYTLNSTNL